MYGATDLTLQLKTTRIILINNINNIIFQQHSARQHRERQEEKTMQLDALNILNQQLKQLKPITFALAFGN